MLLVDGHAAVREGMRRLLESARDIALVGEGSTGREAIQLADALTPDVVVLDLRMSELNSWAAIAEMRDRHADIRFVATTLFTDESIHESMREVGAAAVVVKDTATGSLLTAVRTACARARCSATTSDS